MNELRSTLSMVSSEYSCDSYEPVFHVDAWKAAVVKHCVKRLPPVEKLDQFKQVLNFHVALDQSQVPLSDPSFDPAHLLYCQFH